MLKFVRNLSGFSEFQLGIIQSWANDERSRIVFTPDFQVVRVLGKSNNLILLYWEYGEEPMISVGNSMMELAELKAYLKDLSDGLPPELMTAMNELMTSISELLEGTQWF